GILKSIAGGGNLQSFGNDLEGICSTHSQQDLIPGIDLCTQNAAAAGENAVGDDNRHLTSNGIRHASNHAFEHIAGERQWLIKRKSESTVGVEQGVYNRDTVQCDAVEILRETEGNTIRAELSERIRRGDDVASRGSVDRQRWRSGAGHHSHDV